MLSIVIVLLPVVMSNWIVVPIWLQNFSVNIGLNLAQCEEQHHVDAPSNPVRTSESVTSKFGDGTLASFDKRDGQIFVHGENVSDVAKMRGKSLLTVNFKPLEVIR